MVVLLNESVLWWHWIILGLVLLILEINTGTILLLGLGLSAIFVGLIGGMMDLSFIAELLLFSILSTFTFTAWKRWGERPIVTSSGQSNHSLDTLGTVNIKIAPHQRGKVIFDTPVLGNTLWHATSEEDIAENTRVKIIDIRGQLMVVQTLTNSH